jgi:phospholipid transport system transporter-binding protein
MWGSPVNEPRLTETGDGRWLLEGELNFSSVLEVLGAPFTGSTAGREIQVDLKGVTRVDSAGLALLVEWQRESERAGKAITFIHVPEQLLAIASLCGLEEILSFKAGKGKKSDDKQ